MEYKKVILEGNIGSGKTTLINFLKKKITNINITDSGFNLFHPNLEYNIIEYNKESPGEWSFLVQLTFMKLLNKLQNKKFLNKINIFNRSIYSVHNVFNQVYNNENLFSIEEYQYLTNIYNNLLTKEIVPIDLLIFFKSTSKVLEKRIINNSFKKNIHKYQIYYNELLNNFQKNKNIKYIYIIDGDKSIKDLEDDYNKILKLLSE